MKTILVKIHNAKQTVAETTVVTNDGKPTVIKAHKNVNYELIDQATGRAPHHIVTKRVGKDLHISLETKGKETDLIIEDFYDGGDSALIGLAEDGQYYYYIPDTGKAVDYVTELAVGDIEGQALGGTAYPTPWWIGATEGNASFVPWLVALAGIGAGILFARDKDVVDTTAPSVPEVVLGATDVRVISPASTDLAGINITYIDRTTGNPVTVTFSVDANGKPVDNNAADTIRVDTNGNIIIPITLIKEGTEVKAVAIDQAGNTSSDQDTTPIVPPSSGTLTIEDAGDAVIGLPPDLEAGDVVAITVPKANGDITTVTLTKNPDSSLTSSDPSVIPNQPAGTTEIRIPATDLKDGGKIKVVTKTGTIIGGEVEETAKDTITEAKVKANEDGTANVIPQDRKYPSVESPIKFDGEYVNANNVKVPFGAERDSRGEWKLTANTNPALSIDPTTGVMTIPRSELKDGSEVEAKQTFAGGIESSYVSDTVHFLSAGKPIVKGKEVLKDGSASVEPSTPDATKVGATYTDEQGNPQTVTATKDLATNTWTKDPANTNDKVSVDPTTGKITIPADEVKDGSEVVGTQSTPNGTGTSSAVVDNATGTHPVIPNPVVTNNNDGSISVTPTTSTVDPNKSATSATATYTDEQGNPQTVTATKDPATNTWTKDPANTNDKVSVDPTTGKITIPADEVKDGSEVKGTQTTPIGTGVDTVITKDNIPEPTVVANDNGTVSVTPTKDATSLSVAYVDEDNKLHTVEATKTNGEWVSNNPDVMVDKATGVIVIPADQLRDGSEVVANQTTPQGISGDATDRVKAFDNTDKPTVTEQPKNPADNDSDITAKPGNDNTKVTTTFTDEDGKPQTIVTEKDPTTGEWKPVTTGSTVPVSTTPTTDGKTPYIDPKTGTVTLPKDSVDNNKPVTVTGEKEGSTPAVDKTNPTEKPTVTVTPPTGQDNDSDITAKPGNDNTKVTTTFTDEDGKPQTIVTEKDPTTGEWKPVTTGSTVPVSTTPTTDGKTPYIDPKTGTVTLPKDSVDNNKPVTVTGEKEGSTPAVDKTNPTEKPTVTVTPPTGQDNDSDITAKPGNDNTKVTTTFTDEDGKPQTIVTEKDPTTGEWKPVTTGSTVPVSTTPTTDGKTPYIDPKTGTVTLPKDSVDNNKPVTVTGEKEGSTPAVDKTNPTEKPTVTVTPPTGQDNDSDITAKPGNDNTKVTTTFTDEDGKPQTIVTEKDPTTGEWKPVTTGSTVPVSTTPTTDGKTPYIDPKTGTVTLPKDSVDNNKPVTVTGEKEGSTPAVDKTNPTEKPTVTVTPPTGQDNDSDITAKPGNDNTKVTTTFTDEDGKPQTIVTEKDPTTGEWKPVTTGSTVPVSTTPTTDGKTPYIDPKTGTVTLPKDSVDNNKPVTVTGEKEGSTPAKVVINDITPPTLVGNPQIPTSGDKIELTFSEPLDPNNPPSPDNFPVMVGGQPVTPTKVTVEGNKVTLDLPNKVEATTPVTVGYTDPTTGDDTNAAQDPSGNDVATIAPTPVTNNSGADITPPTLVGTPQIPTSGDKIELTFSEPLDPNNPPSPDNFPVMVGGQPVTPTKVTVEGNKVTLDLPNKVEATTPVTVGYTDPTTGDDTNAAQDPSGNDVATIAPTPVTNNSGADITPPTLVGTPQIPTSGDKIELTFSEPLDPNNPPSPDNFPVMVGGQPVTPTKVTVEGNKVTLDLPNKVEATTPVTVGYTDPTTGDDTNAAQDPSGNDVATIAPTPVTNNSGADITPPTLVGTPQIPTSGDKIELTFSEPLDPNNPPSPDNFPVMVGGQPVTPTKVTVEGNKVTLDLPNKVEATTPVTVGYTDPTTGDDTNAAQDPSGNDVATIAPTPVTNNSGADITPPTLVGTPQIPTSGDKIELTFSEPLDPNNPPSPDNFPVMVGGQPVTPTKVTVEGNKVTLDLPNKVEATTPVTVGYTDPTTGDDTNAAQDPSGNDVATIAPTPVTNNSGADITPPTLVGTPQIPTSGDKIELTFSEPLDPNNPPSPDNFPVMVGGQPVTPTKVTVEGNKVTLDLPNKVEATTPVTVGYTDPTTGDDTNAAQDPSGNDVATIAPTPVTNNSGADITPPTLVGTPQIPTSGDKIELTFSEPLDPNNPPSPDNFPVMVGGQPVTPTKVTVEGNKVTLDLPNKVEATTPVTVGYTDPTTGDDTNAAQDPSGNDVATIAPTPVTNNSGADITPPTLVGTPQIPTSGDKIELTFSEPLDPNNPPSPDNFPVMVGGQPVTPTKVTVEGNKVTLDLPNKVEATTPVTVGYTDPTTGDDTNAAQDPSGNDVATIAPTPVTNNSGADITPPTLVGTPQIPTSGDKIELTFSEPLDPNNPPSPDNFPVMVGGQPVTPTKVTVEGNKVTLDLPNKVEATTPVTVGYTDPTTGDDTNAAQDPSGNDVATIAPTPVTNNSGADITPPTLVGTPQIPTSGDKIELTFSEPLDPNNPPSPDNFPVMVGGQPVTPTKVTVEGNKVTLDLPNKVEATTPVTVGYTDPTTGDDTNAAQDPSGNDVATIAPTPVTNNSGADITPPTLVGTPQIPTSGDKIELTFSEPLDPNNPPSPDNFPVMVGGQPVTPTKVTVEGNKVTLDLPNKVEATTPVTVGYTDPTTGDDTNAAQDPSGNDVATIAPTPVTNNSGADITPPTLVGTPQIPTSGDKIELTFSEPLDPNNPPSPDNFPVMVGGQPVTPTKVTVEGNKVTLDLPNKVEATTPVTVGYTDPTTGDDTNAAQDPSGNDVATIAPTPVTNNSGADITPPTLVGTPQIPTSGDKIELTFSEPLDPNNPPSPDNFPVMVGGQPVTPTKVTVEGNKVTLDLPNKVEATTPVTVGYTDPTTGDDTNAAQDPSGNDVATIAPTPVTNNSGADITPPTLVGTPQIPTSGDKIELTFSEPLDPNNPPSPDNFPVMVGGQPVTPTKVTVEGNKVTLDLPNKVEATTPVTVGYTDPTTGDDTNAAQDPSGNDVATIAPTPVTNNSGADITPPTLVGTPQIPTSGDKIELTFSEPLDPNNPPSPDNFPVMVGGQPVTPTKVTVEGNKVTLDLPNKVEATTPVTVGYTDPTTGDDTNAAQDPSGNDVATIAPTPVTNNSGADITPPTLVGTPQIPTSGDKIELTFSEPLDPNNPPSPDNFPVMVGGQPVTPTKVTVEGNKVTLDLPNKVEATTPVTVGYTDPTTGDDTNAAQDPSGNDVATIAPTPVTNNSGADITPPTLVGTPQIPTSGDKIELTFSEPLDPNNPPSPDNFPVMVGGQPVTPTKVTVEGNKVTLDLPNKVEATTPVTVGYTDPTTGDDTNAAQDPSGNDVATIAPTPVTNNSGADITPPTLVGTPQIPTSGDKIELTFSEPLDPNNPPSPDNFPVMVGGQPVTPTKVTVEGNKVTLDLPNKVEATTPVTVGYTDPTTGDDTNAAQDPSGNDVATIAPTPVTNNSGADITPPTLVGTPQIPTSGDKIELTFSEPLDPNNPPSPDNFPVMVGGQPVTPTKVTVEGNKVTLDLPNKVEATTPVTVGYTDPTTGDDTNAAQDPSGNDVATIAPTPVTNNSGADITPPTLVGTPQIPTSGDKIELTFSEPLDPNNPPSPDNFPVMVGGQPVTPTKVTVEGNKVTLDLPNKVEATTPVTVGYTDPTTGDDTNAAQDPSGNDVATIAPTPVTNNSGADITPPTLVGTPQIPTSGDKIELTFSEPLDPNNPPSPDNFPVMVGGQPVTPTKVTVEGNKVTLDLPNKVEATTPVTVGYTDPTTGDDTNAAQDPSGNDVATIAPTPVTNNSGADITPPTLVGTPQIPTSGDKIELTFSEPLDPNNPPSPDNFPVMVGGQPVTPTKVTVEGNKVTLDLPNKVEATTPVTVGYTDPTTGDDTNAAQDPSGNDVATIAPTPVTNNSGADITPPTLVGTPQIPTSGDKIELTFSEPLDPNNPPSPDNFPVMVGGQPVTPTKVTVEGNKVTLDLPNKVEATTPVTVGYTDPTTGDDTNAAQDPSGNDVATIAPTPVTNNSGADITPPTLVGTPQIPTSGDKIELTFSEPLDPNNPPSPDNFPVMVGGQPVTPTKVTVEGNKVTLDLPNKVEATTPVTVGYTDPTTGDDTNAAQDPSGNDVATIAPTPVTNNSGADITPPTLVGTPQIPTSGDKIELTFSEPLDPNNPPSPDNFPVMVGGQPVTPTKVTVEGNKVTLDLPNKVEATTPVTVGYTDPTTGDDTNAAQDPSGNDVATIAPTPVTNNSGADITPPTLVGTPQIPTSGDKIELTFSEPLDPNNPPSPDNFPVMVGGQPVTPTKVTVEGNKVTLDLPNKVEATTPVTVGYTDPTTGDDTNAAQDPSGNDVATIAPTPVTNNSGADITPPTLVGTPQIPTSGDKIELTFSEPLDPNNPPSPDNFPVMVGGQPVTPTKVTVEGNKVTLDLPNKVEATTPVTVGYTDPTTGDDTNAAQDPSGNDVATIAPTPVTNNSGADITPPTLVGTPQIPTSGDKIELTFSEPLDPNNPPSPDNFPVMVGGQPVTPTKVTVEGNKVTLDLPNKVEATTPVTVGYTDPTTGDDPNATQDPSGNDVATIAPTPVDNNSGADITPPTLVGTPQIPTSGDKIELTFSEPLDPNNPPSPDNFPVMVGGQPVTPTKVTVEGNKVTLDLPNKVEATTPVTVGYTDPTTGDDTNAAQDPSGNDVATIAPTPVTNNSGADITPPTLVGTPQIPTSGDKIELTFSEPLDPNNPPSPDNFPVMVGGQPVTPTKVTVEGNKVTLDLPNKVEATTPVTVGYTDPTTGDDTNAAQDPSGNDVATIAPTPVTNNSGADITPPTLVGTPQIPTSGDKIELTFSEPLDPNNPPSPDNFPVMVGGQPVTPTKVTVEGNKVTLDLPNKVEATTPVTVGYTDPTTGDDTNAAQDPSGNDVATIAPTPVTNNSGADITPPTLVGNPQIPTSGDKIELTFSEPLDPNNPPSPDNFPVMVGGQPVTPTKVTVEGNKVTLDLPNKVEATTPVTVGYTDPTTGDDTNAAQDPSGNDVATIAPTPVTNNSGADITPPTLVGTPQIPTSGDKIELTFSEPLDPNNPPSPDNFPVMVGGQPVTPTKVTVEGNKVTLDLPNKVEATTPVTVGYTDPTTGDDTNAAQDPSGNDVATIAPTPVTNNSGADITPPTLVGTPQIPTSGDKIELTFSEPLDPNNPPSPDNFPVMVGGQPVTPTKVTVEGNKVTLDLPNKVEATTPVTVGYTDPTTGDDTNAAQDPSGNDVATIAPTPVTNNSGADITPPTLVGTPQIPTSGDKIELTFSEPLDPNNPPSPDNFPVMVGGQPVTPTKVTVEGNKVTLDLPNKVEATTPVTVGYTDPTTGDDTNAAQDPSGNDVATIAPTPVTNNSGADITPPTLVGTPQIPTSGDKIELTFSEPLDPNNPPSPDNFPVMVGGQPVTPTKVTVEGNKVTLDLPNKVEATTPVTVGYTDPTTGDDTNAAQDPSGNDVASFDDKPVDNKSTVTPPTIQDPAITSGQSIVVTPGADNLKVVITYKDESGEIKHNESEPVSQAGSKEYTITLTRPDLNSDWTMTTTNPNQTNNLAKDYKIENRGGTDYIVDSVGNAVKTAIKFDPKTGEVTLPETEVHGGSTVTAVGSRDTLTSQKVTGNVLIDNTPAADRELTGANTPTFKVENNELVIDLHDARNMALEWTTAQGEIKYVYFHRNNAGSHQTTGIPDTDANSRGQWHEYNYFNTPTGNYKRDETGGLNNITEFGFRQTNVGDAIGRNLHIPLGLLQAGSTVKVHMTDVVGTKQDVLAATSEPVPGADVTPPTVALSTADTAGQAGSTKVVTFTFNEAPQGFTKEDVAVTNGEAIGNLTKVNDTTYTAQIKLGADTAIPTVVSVASGAFTDAAQNANTDGDQADNKVQIAVTAVPAPTKVELAKDPVNGIDFITAADIDPRGNTTATITLPDGVQKGDRIVFTSTTHRRPFEREITDEEIANKQIVLPVTAPADGQAVTVTAQIKNAGGALSPLSANASDTETRDSTRPLAPTKVEIATEGNFITPTDVSRGLTPVTIGLPEGLEVGDKVVWTHQVTTGQVAGAETPTTYTLTETDIAAKSITVQARAPLDGESMTITAKIVDKAGNESLPSTTSPRTDTDTEVRDSTPPRLIDKATTGKDPIVVSNDGKTITLEYNETLDAGTTPDKAKFAVSVNGSAVTPEGVKVEGNKVTLTLADNNAIKQGQTVMVGYTDQANNQPDGVVQDPAGNDAATFRPTEATNGSTVPAVVAPPAPTPVAGASSTVKMVIGTNDVIFKDTIVKFDGVKRVITRNGEVDGSQSTAVTANGDGSQITWGTPTGGSTEPSGIKAQAIATGSAGTDVNELGISGAVATLTHHNSNITRNSSALAKTSLVMSTTIEINGKPVKVQNVNFGDIYAVEATGNNDYFVFKSTAHDITIDGKQYSISLDNVNITQGSQDLAGNKSTFASQFLTRPTAGVPQDLRNMGADAFRADNTITVISSPETTETVFNLNFKVEAKEGQQDTILKATDPAPITGNIGGTGNWTAGTGHTGVTVESAGANTFNVKKGDVIMGKLVGQTNGAYSFDPTIEGAQAIKNGEKLVANFKHGTSDLSLELNGMYVADANKLSNDDKVDSVYVSKTADVSLSSLLDVKADMIDLTGSANSLQGVTLANVRTFTQNSGSPLYIRGDAGDKVTLGDVLASGATTQADGTTTWTKGVVKTGSTIDGDTTTKYDTWTNGTVNLYIDQDITVL